MDDHPALPTLEAGTLLAGRYRLGPLLGAGGMASVHRATDEVLRRDVAVKVLAHTTEDPVARQRERAEIDMLATLGHRSLVTIFDAATVRLANGMSTIIVMELVDGPTLARRRAQGPIADADLVRLVQDMAEALAVVHARGIVHRDVKPSNILLAPSPLARREFDARLADFGIAALESSARLTVTGTVLGTAAYLSPEQAEGARATPSADIYALGLVVLETITGVREFPGPMIEALTARMLRDPVVPPTVHPRWGALLTAMTARAPEDRPTAEDLLDAVSALANDRVPTLLEEAPTAILPAAGVAAAVLPGGAAVAAASSSSSTTPTTTAPVAIAPDARRRRIRRGVLVGAAAASFAALALVVHAIALQPPATPDAPVEVAETAQPSIAPSPTTVADPAETPTVADPVETPTTVVDVTPQQPVQPVVTDAPATDGGSGSSNGNGNGTGNGSGNGSGNGNGPGSNSGNGNGNG